MNSRVQCGLTAGVAIVGAGVMAVTPITPQAIQPPRVLEAAVALAAQDFSGLDQQQLIQLSAQRFAEQLAQAPFIPLLAALDVVGNDPARLYSAVKNVIDAPLYVADPLLEAIADTLPAALGGGSNNYPDNNGPDGAAGDGGLMQFRTDTLLSLRDDVFGKAAAQLIGVDPTDPDVHAQVKENYAWDLFDKGLSVSTDRFVKSAAAAPLGLVPIAVAIATGNKDDLYSAIREYIDAPLYVADPTIEQLARALPDSLGGGTDGDFHTTDPVRDGGLMQFRTKTLIADRDAAHHALAGVLGVNLDSNDNPVITPALVPSGASAMRVATQGVTNKPDVAKFKPHATNLSTALKKAHDQAEKRAEKAKERRVEAAKNVQQAVKSLTKKLAPKKPSVKKAEKGSSSD